MKYVIIKEENADKIMGAFEKAQGKATARTVDSFRELKSICDSIDNRLLGMTKTAKEGTKVSYTFQQHFPTAYRYIPESTHFDMIFKSGTWRVDIDGIGRYNCPNLSKYYKYELFLSDTAKAWILEQYK